MKEKKVEIPELVKKTSTSYKIIIPQDVEKQIRYLCRRIWDNEWSGILFYTVEGTFEDNLTIICKDILPMDIGTGAATEFDMNPDVISYMAENPELLDCKMGLIHSHNNMKAFFSGTDLNTLRIEGNERNHFVSLIVNNEGKYVAGITRKIEFTQLRKSHYTGFDGIIDVPVEEEETGSEIEWFSLEVEIEKDNSLNTLSNRLDQIEEERAAEVARRTKEKAEVTRTIKNDSPFNLDWTNWYKRYNDNPGPSETVKSIYDLDDEPTLFDSKELKAAETEHPKEPEYDYEDIPTLEISEKSIKAIVLQLVTGCIAITNSKDSVKNLAKNMTKVFDNRFGKDEEGMVTFKKFADNYVDFIMWWGIPESVEIMDDSQLAGLADLIIEELKKLPQNRYIEEYISILEGYSRYK